MKKKLLSLILAGLTSAVLAAQVEPSEIKIDNIEVGKMDGDIQASQFSLLVNFHNDGDDITKWRIGFYMPRSFFSLSAQNINPELELQVCDAVGGCANLRYVKSSPLTASDTSQGYFTMLEPLSSFTLKHKGRYSLRLAHNNQWGPGNVSALPQSWFIIADDKVKNGVPRIYTINTELNQYNLLGYDQNQIDEQLTKYITANWQNSMPVPSNLINIIPSPVSVTQSNLGDYTLPTKTVTIHNQLNADNTVATYWSAIIKKDWQISKKVLVDNDANANDGIIITPISDPKAINNNPEGYRLTISSNGILIETLTEAGAYYALQTLRQLWSQNPQNLPSLSITDYPRFKYRGVLLDTARHYFTPSEIDKLIDVMASQKLNTLHLHFSDDEAFRLALPDYPTLATVASTRGLGQPVGPNMLLQNNLDTTNMSQPVYPVANSVYSGSYTPADIKAIVAYANANQISVIPEIDLPGHARALIKALPDVMVDPNDNSQFVSVQGYTDDVLPVCTYGTDITVGSQFTPTINNIVNSVANLFNQQTAMYAVSNEVSVGGDEVSSHAWTNDTSCRNEWSGLSALAKSHLFFQKLALANNNLIFSGWQQAIQTDGVELGKNTIPVTQAGHVWVWNPSADGVKQAVTLANNNYPTVLAYADKAYFDLAYTPSMYEPGFAWAAPNLDTYSALSMAQLAGKTQALSKQPQNILGIEGTLWSENLPSFDHLMYSALPKMPGLAEAAWSPNYVTTDKQQLNWQSLATRLGCGETGFLAYLNKLYGVNYRGYPNGISKEIPDGNSLCPEKSALTPPNL